MSDEMPEATPGIVTFTRDELAAVYFEYCHDIRHPNRSAVSQAFDKLTRAYNDMQHYGAVTIHVEGHSTSGDASDQGAVPADTGRVRRASGNPRR